MGKISLSKRTKILPLVAFVFIGFSTFSQKPKLIVGIVVDQMRWEYLYRFENDFGDYGFKRMISKGYQYTNAHYNYVPTYTGHGHASIYTGTSPNRHGIIGNTWYNKQESKYVYCVEDEQVIGLGSEGKEGKMSPRRLQATTITDELKLFTNFKSKVIGISIKDRGAILPAGHFADGAYWFSKSGAMISSSFYRKRLPKWVKEFNKKKHYFALVNNGWHSFLDKKEYQESRADDSPYESKFGNKEKPIFPYDLKSMMEKDGPSVIKSTPFGNDFLMEFAKTAIKEEQMGKNHHTDFLALSFSSTDYIGHIFGPYSKEIQDTYIRLDHTLADFLRFLDAAVGKGEYLVFLTADHAVAPNAHYLKEKGFEVDFFNPKEFDESLKRFSIEQFGSNVIKNYSNLNIFLNHREIANKKLSTSSVINKIKSFVLKHRGVKRVFTEDQLVKSNCANQLAISFFLGYDPKQNGEIVFSLNPGWIEYSYETGTTHGSAYSYDTHVPLLWYGGAIKPGFSTRKVSITEIAPTLSQLLKISMPNATKGIILDEIVDF